MTQVGENYAQGMKSLGGSLVTAASLFREDEENKNLGQQQAPVNMSKYQQIADLTGTQIDPTLLEQYGNRSQMSGPELGQFNKSLQDATSQALLIDELRRKQQAFQMQQSALQRASQSQALQSERDFIRAGVGIAPLGLPYW
jgi:hypothetical protein